jgi:hypothetical protein
MAAVEGLARRRRPEVIAASGKTRRSEKHQGQKPAVSRMPAHRRRRNPIVEALFHSTLL